MDIDTNIVRQIDREYGDTHTINSQINEEIMILVDRHTER